MGKQEFSVGITLDNYKISRYKKVLGKKGYANLTVTPFTKDTSLLKIKVKRTDMAKVKKICEQLETYFLSRRN